MFILISTKEMKNGKDNLHPLLISRESCAQANNVLYFTYKDSLQCKKMDPLQHCKGLFYRNLKWPSTFIYLTLDFLTLWFLAFKFI